jgi:hypothetical protein
MSDPTSPIPLEGPPISHEVVRATWRAHLFDVRGQLEVGGLTLAGLDREREQLRTGDWQCAALPADVRVQHALLLDQVVEQLVRLRPDMADYYARDRLPLAPDDASELDTP